MLDVHGYRPDMVRSSLPIDAIVLPSVGSGQGPKLQPASGAAALRALAPTTLLQLPGAAHARMRAMADLVRRVPAFSLELGADMSAVPDLIAGICAERSKATSTGNAED